MKLFISEYVCSGAWTETLDDSTLLAEAKGMLLAALSDFSSEPDIRISTTWDSRLGPFPLPDIEVIVVETPEEEHAAFTQQIQSSNAAFIIAPEFSSLLADRCEYVNAAGKTLIGPDLTTIQIFADKLATYEFLTSRNIPTIQTFKTNHLESTQTHFVHKPRFGAGSVATRIITHDQLPKISMTSEFGPMLLQPYLEGTPLSLSVLAGPRSIDLLPLTRQHLSTDGALKYTGCTLPAESSLQKRAEALVQQVIDMTANLRGYLGFDLLYLPHTDELLIVEVNPRLTTSYLAYRQLTSDNLLARLLKTESSPVIQWHDTVINFHLA